MELIILYFKLLFVGGVSRTHKEVQMYGKFNYAMFGIYVIGCYCCSLAEITGRNINTRIHVGGVI